ncbi:DUF4184 family protein [Paenibacillus sp. FSL K6-0276]|uniref:DUF4184 family protein n=1 Tax=Paenibacillus sp. FSL K6-0276 TaxID=2921450 RepID=UPI0030EDF03D
MPFTFAHPIFALPFKYVKPKYFSATGLILGSMSPDFEYFIMLEPYQSIGHSVTGLFLQAIPLCVIIALIFHFIIKEILVLHLPSNYNIDQRAYNTLSKWSLNSKGWVVFSLSVIIGFLTHVFIDGFTHFNGYFVELYPPLRDLMIYNFPLYKILQHSFSVFGLLMITWIIGSSLYRHHETVTTIPVVSTKQKNMFWTSVVVVAVALTSMKLLFSSSRNIIGILVVSPITGTCLGILLTSIIIRVLQTAKQ